MSKQKEVKGFKLVKLRTKTIKILDNYIKKMEAKQPYLKGIISYNTIIEMLLMRKEIKLTKYRYLKRIQLLKSK